MNLTRIKRDAKTFFRRLVKMGLAGPVTYKHFIDSEYDTVKGKEVSNWDDNEIVAFLTGFKRSELSDDVRITDLKAIVLVDGFGATPTIEDIVISNDTTYTVISFTNNPFEAVITLQLRSA